MKTVILAAMVTLLPLWAASQNLVVNPGAETLPVIGNGWTLTVGNMTAAGCWVNPPCQEGSHLFYANAFANSECFQIVDVSAYATTIDNGTQQFAFVDYTRSFPQTPADAGRAIVEYRNGSGTILGSYDSGYQSSTSAWIPLSDTRFAPVGTRSIKVRLLSKRNNGTNNDAYHDDISLVALEVLPVEMIDFQAFAIDNRTMLSWQTASEQNNDGFYIERMAVGQHWVNLGFEPGNGTTLEAHEYFFWDEFPLPGVNYYRLRQIDFNGTAQYSKVVSIDYRNSNGFGSLRLYPNPATTQLQFDKVETDGFDCLQIFDLQGKQVFKTQILNSQINIEQLQKGMYFVKLSGTLPTQTQHFIKN